MPSRAVLRKKQRRDARRKKAQGEAGGSTPSHRIAPPHLDDENASGAPASRAAHLRIHSNAGAVPSRKRLHETSSSAAAVATDSSFALTTSSTPDTATTAAVLVAKRPRREPAPPSPPMPGGLTRKERHRWETSRRLERQMTKLSATAEAVQEMLADAAAQKGGTSGHAAAAAEDEDGVTTAAPVTEPKLRHDPKFKHGTFWRDRKEKRARTLFLGGIPSYFTVKQVMDFISTVVDSDHNAVDYVYQIGKDKDVVEEVDMLPVKHNSKVKHMYVTMASVPLAGCAAAMLDRYKMEGRELRCNFAADKTQREEAIRRRNAIQR